jgi:LAO/AO transport system kinase
VRPSNPAELVADSRTSRRALARLLSLVEDRDATLPEIMARLVTCAGRAVVVGVTGPPGAGKSTTTSALVAAWRAAGRRVAVLAVDPSSPVTGGALLGDRIRMQAHALDPGVFIRSMASRGHLGGLSAAAPQAIRVLEAAGFDVVVVETVGVGQADVEVAAMADTTVVLVAPGMGDGVQAAKAGILEVGDVLVVNKADHDGARATLRDLRQMLGLGAPREPGAWRPVVVATVATTGDGVADLVEALDKHRDWLQTGEGAARRARRAQAEIQALALDLVRRLGPDEDGGSRLAALASDVAAGRLDPYTAAERLLDRP